MRRYYIEQRFGADIWVALPGFFTAKDHAVAEMRKTAGHLRVIKQSGKLAVEVVAVKEK